MAGAETIGAFDTAPGERRRGNSPVRMDVRRVELQAR